MPHVAFFISTGRCGTQWLASNLRDEYTDLAVVTHEPLGPRYRPKEFFRAYDDIKRIELIPEIAAHLDDISLVKSERIYIETGWPCYSAVPLLIERFGTDLRLVHLVRHPVHTAMSLVTHQFYSAERQDEYVRFAQLDPHVPGVFHSEYASRWNEMTRYEKCLFWWTEINLYGREIASRFPSIRLIQMRMEDLLGSDSIALERLTAFLGLPFRLSLSSAKSKTVDGWNFQTDQALEWRQIFDHPGTVTLAKEYGYNFEMVDQHVLDHRYKAPGS